MGSRWRLLHDNCGFATNSDGIQRFQGRLLPIPHVTDGPADAGRFWDNHAAASPWMVTQLVAAESRLWAIGFSCLCAFTFVRRMHTGARIECACPSVRLSVGLCEGFWWRREVFSQPICHMHIHIAMGCVVALNAGGLR